MTWDLLSVLILLGIISSAVLAYLLRALLKGRARFERLDRPGMGSPLLGRSIMEGAYWVFQPMADFMIKCRMTADRLTWTSLVLGLLAGASLALGHFGFGTVFATASAFLDMLDGMVARKTGLSSEAGQLLDSTVDRYVEFLFLAGLVVYYRGSIELQALSMLALLGSFMISYSTAKAESLGIKPPEGIMRRPERALYLLLGTTASALMVCLPEESRPSPDSLAYPMSLALGLVALLSNVSAVRRFRAITQILEDKKRNGAAQ